VKTPFTSQQSLSVRGLAVVVMVAVVVSWVIFVTGCAPKQPDRALILWEQPAPQIAAKAHAKEISGIARPVSPTGSMEPHLFGGDWIVINPAWPWAMLKPRDLANYQASWLPPDVDTVTHMCAAKSGDEWIMDGIANAHYEKGTLRMVRADYRGKVVQVYTRRAKR